MRIFIARDNDETLVLYWSRPFWSGRMFEDIDGQCFELDSNTIPQVETTQCVEFISVDEIAELTAKVARLEKVERLCELLVANPAQNIERLSRTMPLEVAQVSFASMRGVAEGVLEILEGK